MGKRGVRVIDLEDFMCRCGGRDFDREIKDGTAAGLTCRGCGRHYSVRKRERRTRSSNLPMSFGFRSLYWDKIEASERGVYGVNEMGYEIREE